MKKNSRKAILLDTVTVYCINKKEAAWLEKEFPDTNIYQLFAGR